MKFLLLFVLCTTWTTGYSDDLCKTCSCDTSDDAQILTINCTAKGLLNVGSEWPIKNETKTIKINYTGNSITTLEPMPKTDAILEIVVSRCNVTYLRPGLFSETKNVRFVDLSYNNLEASEISSDKYKGPYNDNDFEPIALEHLDLSYNKIHSIGKNVFEHMPNLKILNLEGNDFTVLDMHTQLALSSVRNLQMLNLANNELTEMIAGAIETHENLTVLDLSNNLLDFVPKSLARIGKSLQVLKLDGNPIIEFVSDTFLGLNNVVELSANNLSKLKYVNAGTFAPMPQLKKLSLSENYMLTDIDREAFGVNQSLEEFYLNDNNLDRIDYKLLPWSKLHIFEFDENPLDCSCDLYNITADLPKDITRKENSPYCADPRTGRFAAVFYLKSDICIYKPRFTHREFIEYHFSVVRLTLIILSVVVMVAGLLAAILGFVKYKRYQREVNYPYASQIAYNPVSTTSKY